MNRAEMCGVTKMTFYEWHLNFHNLLTRLAFCSLRAAPACVCIFSEAV